jgi:hypothetical protein
MSILKDSSTASHQTRPYDRRLLLIKSLASPNKGDIYYDSSKRKDEKYEDCYGRIVITEAP